MARLTFHPVLRQLDERPDPAVFSPHSWERLGSQDEEDNWAWDYTVDLSFERLVEFNPARLAGELGLASDVALRLTAEWSSDLAPLLRGSSFIHQFVLSDDEFRQVALRLDVPGEKSGGTLTLNTYLVVADSDAAPLGTPVWEDSETIELERHATRVPVSVVSFSDFSRRFGESRARWWVELYPDAYDLPLSTALHVFLNADHEEFVERVVESEDALAGQWFTFEVARHLMQRALLDESFELVDPQYEPGTLGDSLHTKIAAVFAPRSAEEARSMAVQAPHEFDAIVQAHSFQG